MATGTKLSNILITQQYLYLPKFLELLFLLLLHLGCTNNHRSTPFVYLLCCCGIRFLSLFVCVCVWGNLLSYYSDAEGPGDRGSGFFIAEEADGVGDKGSGNNTSVDVETLWWPFWRTSTLPQLQKYQIFGGSAFRLKEFCCKWRL